MRFRLGKTRTYIKVQSFIFYSFITLVFWPFNFSKFKKLAKKCYKFILYNLNKYLKFYEFFSTMTCRLKKYRCCTFSKKRSTPAFANYLNQNVPCRNHKILGCWKSNNIVARLHSDYLTLQKVTVICLHMAKFRRVFLRHPQFIRLENFHQGDPKAPKKPDGPLWGRTWKQRRSIVHSLNWVIRALKKTDPAESVLSNMIIQSRTVPSDSAKSLIKSILKACGE